MGVVDDRIAARAGQLAGLLQGFGRLDGQTLGSNHGGLWGSPTAKATSVPGKSAVLAGETYLGEEGASGAPRLDKRALDRSEAHVQGDASRALPVDPRRDART